MSKTKRAATLTIQQPGLMTARGRRDIANWLRQQASDLLMHGHQYTEKRFTAGYNYTRRER